MKNKIAISLVAAVLFSCAPEPGQINPPLIGEWHHAGGSHFSDKYSPLEQINKNNFNELEIAWR